MTYNTFKHVIYAHLSLTTRQLIELMKDKGAVFLSASNNLALGLIIKLLGICVCGQEQTGVVVTYEHLMLIDGSAWHCMNEFLYLDLDFKASQVHAALKYLCFELCCDHTAKYVVSSKKRVSKEGMILLAECTRWQLLGSF